MSLALARKYRPKRFADVAVQSHVSTTLKGAIARGRVAHGYLLCGPRGVGKTTLARVLAMALNCERRADPALGGEPCGECTSCQRIWSGSASLDVVEIDAASNRGVDDARELRERAMYAPSGADHYKVYIVDEAHMLTREAWNALLKILEEPPPRVVFVFATTEPQKITQSAAPVMSRLQRFDFKRIGAVEIRDRLSHVLAEENIASEPEALASIARAADGSMRDALSLTDQVLSMGDGRVTADRVRDALGLVAEDEFIALIDIIADRRAADVFPAVSRLADAGIDFGGFLNGVADTLRSLLTVALGGTATEMSERGREALEARRERIAAADLLRMLQLITELEPRFKKSGQQQLLVETLLVRFALMDRAVEIEGLIRSLGAPGGSGGGAGGSSSARPETSAPPTPRRDVRVDAAAAPVPSAASGPRSVGSPPAPRPSARAGGPAVRAELADAAPVEIRGQHFELVAIAGADGMVGVAPLEMSKLTAAWDQIVQRLRATKPMLATALSHATPAAVTASGVVTIELDEPNDIYTHAIGTGRGEILVALRERFAGIERVDLRRDEQTAAPAPKRLTDEMVRAERVAALRKREPLLDAAIDALDLDVAD
ncbi:MAG TPA: DNA polymerase III subunit gamma/tau [Gemmatimonadaceae bacterium]|jgi:DNA polymerase-3 subunit gamma/tau